MARRAGEFTSKVKECPRKWKDIWKYNNDQYHEFMGFVMGNQWLEDESRVFENYKKIPLTFNKIAPLINHLIGEQRQNTPNLQVVPDDGVDEQTAEVREALVKEISLNSHAKVVYQIAFQQAAIGGFGAYRILTDYENEYSFDQNIIIKSIKDPTKCYWDINAESPCKTDGMYAGFRTRMSRKKFKEVYGKKIEGTIPNDSDDDGNMTFADNDSITILDHYERQYDSIKIYKLSNGRVVKQDEFDKLERINLDDVEVLVDKNEYVTIIDQRTTEHYKIKHYQIAGDWILEETDFASEQLPVIFVDQNSYWDKDGKQICRPFIKDAKDAQRFLNYLGTQIAYLFKVSRYDQFLVSKANVKSPDTQLIWRDPMTVQGGLIYDESPNGNKPEQLRPPELSQSLIQQYQRALGDIQSSVGMYDTQVGEKGNEISGAAIDARTKRGSYNTFVPFDSLNRAIAVGGEITNEMIPTVYDTERVLQLNMKDRGQMPVSINKPMDEYGEEKQNDMTKGRYQIRLLPGPSYEGQKTEALESMNIVLQADRTGQIFPMIADLYVENLPLANNIELKNRLRTLVPPEIIQSGKTGEPPPPKPPQPDPAMIVAQAKMQEAQGKMAIIQQKSQELQQKAQQAQQDYALELQKLETERMEAAAGIQEQELRYAAELHRTQTDERISHAENIVKLLTHQPKSNEPKGNK